MTSIRLVSNVHFCLSAGFEKQTFCVPIYIESYIND